jgi:hypothetical protein
VSDAGRNPTETEQWQAWQRGEARCPYCIGLDDRDFAATCDCSRYSLETTGRPIVIQVIGRPETAQTVMPERIVEARTDKED